MRAGRARSLRCVHEETFKARAEVWPCHPPVQDPQHHPTFPRTGSARWRTPSPAGGGVDQEAPRTHWSRLINSRRPVSPRLTGSGTSPPRSTQRHSPARPLLSGPNGAALGGSRPLGSGRNYSMAIASFLHCVKGRPWGSASNTWTQTWSAPASRWSFTRALTASMSPHATTASTRRSLP